ncbi:MAG: disulfide bond formation protein B [Blastomonas sp.]
MIVSQRQNIAQWLALLLPAGLLGGALFSQYVLGLAPCEMCYWQRWPHWAAIALGAAGLIALPRVPGLARFLGLAAALAIAASGLIGAFHAGVEYGWWQGFTECTSGVAGASSEDLMKSIMNAPLVRCDQPQWTLFGISLAGFNFLISLGGALLIGLLLRAPARTDRTIAG